MLEILTTIIVAIFGWTIYTDFRPVIFIGLGVIIVLIVFDRVKKLLKELKNENVNNN